MSLENVEAVRAVYAEWAEGNFGAGVELHDPLIVFVAHPHQPEAGHYFGKEGLREFMSAYLEPWTKLTFTAEELIDVDNSVVVSVRHRGSGKESGAPTELSFFQVWTFRGRAVVRIETFPERAEALEAVGRSE